MARLAAAYAAPPRSATRTSRPTGRIGEHGLGLIRAHAERRSGRAVNILTHCNAGWLACVDWGTALAPIYRAHDAGIPVHVWVDETRPRNQGASLTACELGAHGVPHTRHRRQCRRPSDAAGAGRSLHRRHRPHHRDRRRRQQDRHLSQGARRSRQQRPVPRGASLLAPSTGASTTAAPSPSRSAAPTR